MNFEKQIVREQQKKQGAFDGRYRTKVVPNKKKEALRKWNNNGD